MSWRVHLRISVHCAVVIRLLQQPSFCSTLNAWSLQQTVDLSTSIECTAHFITSTTNASWFKTKALSGLLKLAVSWYHSLNTFPAKYAHDYKRRYVIVHYLIHKVDCGLHGRSVTSSWLDIHNTIKTYSRPLGWTAYPLRQALLSLHGTSGFIKARSTE